MDFNVRPHNMHVVPLRVFSLPAVVTCSYLGVAQCFFPVNEQPAGFILSTVNKVSKAAEFPEIKAHVLQTSDRLEGK